jgi:hypothetical protein
LVAHVAHMGVMIKCRKLATWRRMTGRHNIDALFLTLFHRMFLCSYNKPSVNSCITVLLSASAVVCYILTDNAATKGLFVTHI